MDNKEVHIYTDGGCKGNPGIGAWAFYVPDMSFGDNGNNHDTTNNRMELMATIEAIVWAKKNNIESIVIYTDSQYVQKGITEWIDSWKKKAWKTAAKKPVKNKDLWTTLDEYRNLLSVSWKWVEGHAGHAGNEKAHDLVTESIEELSASL